MRPHGVPSVELEAEWKAAGREAPEWGARRTILGDLSPAATFIAANYNIPFDVVEFVTEAQKLLDEVEQELGWMYETRHTDGTMGRINYTVWSEVFACRHCAAEIVFLDEAMDAETKVVQATIVCPACNAQSVKEQMDLRFETFLDQLTGRTAQRPRRAPVLINYGDQKFEKKPDAADLELLQSTMEMPVPPELPTEDLPDCQMTRVGRMRTTNTLAVRRMFLPRAAQALAALWRRGVVARNARLRHMLLFFVEQAIWGMSVLNRYQPLQHGRPGGSQVNRQLTGVYYVGSQIAEVNPWYILDGKLNRLRKALARPLAAEYTMLSTGDCAQCGTPNDSVDYIFTDPPFGENLYYADLNFFVESWHGVFTRVEPEAIVDRRRAKTVATYRHLMERCFLEYCRVLKPGRWMTVVFHNSKNTVWNAIQEAIQAAGFVVADVRTLDKKQGSFRQVTSTAVKQDLVISAYKPNGGLEERFRVIAGTEHGAWEFVETHLARLPVFAERDGRSEVMQERQDFLLFDRMVAFHVQRGATVPLSASEFYDGLRSRYPERDGMFFLPEQIPRYDKRRFRVKGLFEPSVVVRDEETAIRWLRAELKRKPQTFQELHPNFIREIGGWAKHEATIELSLLLDENFLCYEGDGPVPGRIHSWLSTTFKELRNLAKDSSLLRRRAERRWYLPDPTKAPEMEMLRQRALLREFAKYASDETRRLRTVRLEAVRAGFRDCWQRKDDATILAVGNKIPGDALHEDPKLLMWYDQALTRTGVR